MQSNVPRYVPRHLEGRISSLKVLVVDDDQYMRKVVRTMLMAIGVKTIHEAVDGISRARGPTGHRAGHRAPRLGNAGA